MSVGVGVGVSVCVGVGGILSVSRTSSQQHLSALETCITIYKSERILSIAKDSESRHVQGARIGV